MNRKSILLCCVRALLVAAVLPVSSVWAAAIGVIWNGTQLGTLTATSTNTGTAASASATITANFTTAGQQAGGAAILNNIAPLGLTYMQTVTVNTQFQQLLFLPSDKTVNNAVVLPNGTAFSDPPQGGYVLFDGSTQFPGDNTPWYSTIAPAGTPGALPPVFNWGAVGGNQQFFDQPTIPWADPAAGSNFFNFPTLYGLANLLNGQNGNISFEAALVGACQIPANLLTGTYLVCVLEDFTWGMNFTYVGPGGQAQGTYTSADYTETIQAINFSNTVSNSFKGAFDRQGNNARIEWNVDFNCPEPAGFVTMLVGLAVLWFYRRRVSGTAGRS
jgi:hypothetical protein